MAQHASATRRPEAKQFGPPSFPHRLALFRLRREAARRSRSHDLAWPEDIAMQLPSPQHGISAQGKPVFGRPAELLLSPFACGWRGERAGLGARPPRRIGEGSE